MSILSQSLEAIKDAMRLTDDVRRAGQVLDALTEEMRDHERRIIKLEAQWKTVMMLPRKRLE